MTTNYKKEFAAYKRSRIGKRANDFRAYYARKIMATNPEFRGFFTLRTTRQ